MILFFQSKFQFHIKFFCTVAKHPLSSPETNSSFFSFFCHFVENLFGFSARPLNLTCCSLSLERIHFLLIQTYIPVFCTPGTVPDSREQRCRITQNPLPSPSGPGAEPDHAVCKLLETIWTVPLPHVPDHLSHPKTKPARFHGSPESFPSTVTQLPSHCAHQNQGLTPHPLPSYPPSSDFFLVVKYT